MIFEDNTRLVNYIKMAIKNRGYTVEDVAKKLGISGQNLHATFAKKNLSFADIQRICNVIGCKLHYSIEDSTPTQAEQVQRLQEYQTRLQELQELSPAKDRPPTPEQIGKTRTLVQDATTTTKEDTEPVNLFTAKVEQDED